MTPILPYGGGVVFPLHTSLLLAEDNADERMANVAGVPLETANERTANWRTQVWVSDLVFGFRLDACHNLLKFIGQLGTGSHWPSRDRWRHQIGCDVVEASPQ